jgi:hypothetical protein
MSSVALRVGRLVLAVVGAASLPIAVAAPAARAGTIWVTDGNMNAGQTGSCNAFGFYGDLAVFADPVGCPMSVVATAVVPLGQNGYWMTTAPTGVTINSAWTSNGDVATSTISPGGFSVGDFWRDVDTGAWGGSTLAANQEWFNTGLEGNSNINSQIYGIQLECTRNVYQGGGCVGAAAISISGIELEGTEDSAPFVTGEGSLWSTGSYVWNPPGDSWPVTLYASDVSGICSSSANAGSVQSNGPPEARDNTVWQQCPNPVSWSFGVDTRSQVTSDGAFPVDLTATNAAGVEYTAQKTVLVDNDPVNVSFATPNDPNPTLWVNHAVTVNATATAGPSGVAGMRCGVDNQSLGDYQPGGFTIDGDGVHFVSCSAWNNAVDPQGQPGLGTSAIAIHIDETPPSLSFEPASPTDPTGLVVDTSDGESGVAGGSLEMAPTGSNAWTTLPTSFDGAHLLAHFDDAGLHGPYTVRATSCDNVGNCASTTEQLLLPLRAASDSQVSLTKIVDPLQREVVAERVLVGWHWATIHRGGSLVRVKRGGHFRTVRVVKYVEQCKTERVQTAPHHWKLKRICQAPKATVTTTLQVPYGHSFTIDGLYTTAAGVPLSGQPVDILAAPNNGTAGFSQVSTVTTHADGSWTATLPAGPSQVIRAVSNGTSTILPSSGQVTTIVPADVRLLKVWPRRVPWGGTVHLVGQLIGGYLPPGGALVRLRIGYGSSYNTYGVQEHVTGDGRFSTVATFGPGDPSIHRTYWFQIASLPMGNYPYAPAASQRVPVIVGGHPG